MHVLNIKCNMRVATQSNLLHPWIFLELYYFIKKNYYAKLKKKKKKKPRHATLDTPLVLLL